MAEHFRGRDHTLHVSNGAAESMLEAWVALGERMPDTADRAAVLAYLRHRLHEHADGGRAFDLDPPPAPLDTPARLRELAQIIAAFASELAQARPDPTLTNINRDRELRLLWLANMLDLHTIIDSALPAGLLALEPIKVDLAFQDRLTCEINQLQNKRGEIDRRARQRGHLPDAQTMLALLDRVIALALQQEPQKPAFLSLLQLERAEYCHIAGDKRAEIAAIRAAANLDPDSPDRAALEELAASLEHDLEE